MSALNIRNKGAVRLVRELATLEGESMTTVVIEAVRERLERVRKQKAGEARIQYWLERGHEIREHLEREHPEWLERDQIADLYDGKTGLPT